MKFRYIFNVKFHLALTDFFKVTLIFKIRPQQVCKYYINVVKGKRLETVKPNQNESISKTELFGANFMQIGL